MSGKMTNSKNKTSLSKAALIAGLGLLVMVIAAPYAELFVYPKLVVAGNPGETVKNITANKTLFISAILGYLVTFICDVVVAWALYVLLKPVNENLSLLTAWFRLVYTVIALVALLNLVNVLQLLNTAGYLTVFEPGQLNIQVMASLSAFRHDW
jgi:phosphoglycerol transferase MdoB-like AlkP superfamily enzyme